MFFFFYACEHIFVQKKLLQNFVKYIDQTNILSELYFGYDSPTVFKKIENTSGNSKNFKKFYRILTIVVFVKFLQIVKFSVLRFEHLK